MLEAEYYEDDIRVKQEILYAGRAYEQLVEKEARYKTKLIKIPVPEFYVFFNGKRDFPIEKNLYLSDAFMKPPGEKY